MNKKNLNQILFLLSCIALQNNTVNAMKRSIELISGPETTEHPPLKQQKLADNAAALVCDICDKSFLHLSKLTAHKRTHTGEKPYSCSFCNRNFSQKGHLTAHKKTHTREKLYSCSYCDKAFVYQGLLTAHERIHTGEKPYSCSLCNKNFTQKGHLTSHERIHTKEKPFSCSLCNTSFAQKGDLIKHEKVHAVEKPFSCSLCNTSFTRKDNFTKHMATHAKNDAPPINSSKTSSKKTPTPRISTRLVPLVIQKTIEPAQTQKNEKVIEEAMQPFNDKDFTDWISSEKNS